VQSNQLSFDTESIGCWIFKENFAKHKLTLYRPAMPLGNRKKYFEDLFSSVLSQFKKYHPSENLKFYNLGILKSLKMRSEIILPISLKLNFTPNTSGCKGLRGKNNAGLYKNTVQSC